MSAPISHASLLSRKSSMTILVYGLCYAPRLTFGILGFQLPVLLPAGQTNRMMGSARAGCLFGIRGDPPVP